MQLIIMRAGAVSIFLFFQHFISSTKDCVLHIVAVNQYLLKNDLEKGSKVLISLFLLPSLNLEGFFFMEAAMCVEYLLRIYLYYLPVTLHEKWNGKFKPLSPFTITKLYY